MVDRVASQVQSAKSTQASGRVISAIRMASEKSGVDFSYMIQKAEQESGLNPTVKAQGSSATGLYQFVEQTWLRTIKEHGADYGLAKEAEQISLSSSGKAVVADPAERTRLLELRKNPEVAALMAAELAKDNKEKLEQNGAKDVGATELYLAHFLGAGGASQFLTKMHDNPNAAAADLLPTAAAANKSVFYGKDGQAKTLEQVYASFASKFDADGSKTIQLAERSSSSAAQKATLAQHGHLQSPLQGQGSGFDQLTQTASLEKLQEEGLARLSGVMTESAPKARIAPVALSQMSSPFAAMLLAQMDYGVL